jgi:PIN domain nuclease of toxin-antitoxin system
VTVLLDTHLWWWWITGEAGPSPGQKRILASISPEEPVLLSDISLWEVTTLVSLGRLALTVPLREWLESAAAAPLVRRCPISPAVADAVAALPEDFHRNPADRLIVAMAQVHGATLLTRDKRIIDARLVPTVR